jgi:hypothetical protein
MMVKAPDLISAAAAKNQVPVLSNSMGWKFGDAPNGMKKISKVHISWPASSYGAEWSAAEGRWLLIHNGNIDSDDTGYQLGPRTLIIQLVSISNSIYHDKVGGVTPLLATVGSGKCYLLRNGGYIPCRWERSSAESGTTFTDESGVEVAFERGQIWFALTDKEPVFTSASMQDASKSASK